MSHCHHSPGGPGMRFIWDTIKIPEIRDHIPFSPEQPGAGERDRENRKLARAAGTFPGKRRLGGGGTTLRMTANGAGPCDCTVNPNRERREDSIVPLSGQSLVPNPSMSPCRRAHLCVRVMPAAVTPWLCLAPGAEDRAGLSCPRA